MQNRALYSSLCSRGIIGLEMEGYHFARAAIGANIPIWAGYCTSDLPLQDLTLDMEGDVHSYTDLVPGIVHLTSLCLQRLQDAHQKKKRAKSLKIRNRLMPSLSTATCST